MFLRIENKVVYDHFKHKPILFLDRFFNFLPSHKKKNPKKVQIWGFIYKKRTKMSFKYYDN